MIPAMAVVFTIFVFAVSLCLVLAIAVPFAGGIVRYRANYTPKPIQLDVEENEILTLSAGSDVKTLFAMYKRIYLLEGISGFYKGYIPTLLLTFASSLLSFALALSKQHLPLPSPQSFYQSLFANLAYTILLLFLTLPFSVFINRAIVTPKLLSWFDARLACRVLLTPAERHRPWLIYLTPGLFVSQVVLATYLSLVLRNARHLLLPGVVPGSIPNSWDTPPFRTFAFVVVVFASTIILTPLDVISVRLLIQRNYGGVVVDTEIEEYSDVPDYTIGEDVISLRTGQEPYKGLFEAGKTIAEEEGHKVLYRLWWLSLFGGFAGALS